MAPVQVIITPMTSHGKDLYDNVGTPFDHHHPGVALTTLYGAEYLC